MACVINANQGATMRYCGVVGLVVCTMFVAGCASGTVTIPATDSTPPEISLHVTQERGNSSSELFALDANSSTPREVMAQSSDIFILATRGKDPEGVKET